MKKIILIGRSECGKTTLIQALKGEKIHYHKTQYVNNFDVVIDTPGEYIQTKNLGGAIAMYSFEADVVGLLLGATEPFSLYHPCVTAQANREVIGIVTQTDQPHGDPEQAERWLRLAGCETVFHVSSYTGEGIWKILEYLREEGDVLPWEKDGANPPTISQTENSPAIAAGEERGCSCEPAALEPD